MLRYIAAKIVFALVGVALIGIGIYFLGCALVEALKPQLGVPGGYAVAGAILVLPPMLCATIIAFIRPVPQTPKKRVELIEAMFYVLTLHKTWRILARVGSVIADELLSRK